MARSLTNVKSEDLKVGDRLDHLGGGGYVVKALMRGYQNEVVIQWVDRELVTVTDPEFVWSMIRRNYPTTSFIYDTNGLSWSVSRRTWSVSRRTDEEGVVSLRGVDLPVNRLYEALAELGFQPPGEEE